MSPSFKHELLLGAKGHYCTFSSFIPQLILTSLLNAENNTSPLSRAHSKLKTPSASFELHWIKRNSFGNASWHSPPLNLCIIWILNSPTYLRRSKASLFFKTTFHIPKNNEALCCEVVDLKSFYNYFWIKYTCRESHFVYAYNVGIFSYYIFYYC